MQTFKSIELLLILLTAMLLFSCGVEQGAEKSKWCTVQVAFEPDFYNESRIDTLDLSKSYTIDTTTVTAPLTDYVGYQTFKIESGKVTISAVSVFERRYSKTIDISSDTIVTFSKKDFPIHFETSSPWEKDLSLKETDTVVIYYFNGSCVTSDDFASKRTISIFKSDANIVAKYTDIPRGTANVKLSYRLKQCNNNIIKELNSFYRSVKKVNEKELTFSTSNAHMHIRVGNKIYQITDPSFSIGNLYDRLITSINES